MIEFEEMQKSWNEQKGETMYTVDESALYGIVKRKKDAASRRINNMEIMISIINGIAGVGSIILAVVNAHPVNFINAGIMIGTLPYIQYFRRKRKQAENTFDRSMLGELDHAISNESSIVRFNHLMVVGYLIPLAIVATSTLIFAGASLDKWLIAMGAFLLSIIILLWEQAASNMPRRNQLLGFRKKLIEG